MPENFTPLQWAGTAVLVLCAVVWVVAVVRILRDGRSGYALWHSGPVGAHTLAALPQGRQSAPPLESVELTPAEQDAFAGLVRGLEESR
ncbi:hypothetical protein AB0O01_07010 [Streptomyces sp. NPDC093252]|uniref:hypothetical protein n=1 Tax=Streptomyces sp. NPDC093252 TaxID=3154980 RepID=UPI0034405C4A